MQEGRGAVDWIDDPAILVSLMRPGLFPEQAVLGVTLSDLLKEEGLHRRVRLRHQILLRFLVDLEG